MDFLAKPITRSFFNIISIIISGILCSALVTEISEEGKVDWSLIFSTNISIFIGVFALILFTYYTYIYKVDVKNQMVLDLMSDEKKLELTFKKGLVKPLISRAKSQVKKGNYEELDKISEFWKGGVSKDDSNSDDGGIIRKT